MKAVTFNIRCDYQQDGSQNFEYRKPFIISKLLQEQPEILFFQEVLPHVAVWLKQNLSDYVILGCGRAKQLDDEQTCIALRKDCFQVISMDTFWLSPTPKIPGSRYEQQSCCPRTVTKLFVQELSSQKLFLLYNTHLDHIDSNARVAGMTQLLADIEKEHSAVSSFGSVSVILAGDFNALPDAPEIALLNNSSLLHDVTSSLPGTFHDFGRLSEPEKIDYIIFSSDINCTSSSLWTDCTDGVYLSDHYPVCVEIDLEL